MEKLYVDASEGATVIFGDERRTPVVCPTLQEAAIHFLKLEPDERKTATIRTKSGRVFSADEVDRLHYK